jgi:ribA/ribD-fused uncharacterized protein
MQTINRFRGQYHFLSNFYPSPVKWEGIVYPTVEHAFQAAKTDLLAARRHIRDAVTPGDAKRLGRQVKLREGWQEARVGVMLLLLIQKFRYSSSLADALLATGDARLEEGNTWGDRFWGTVDGEGRNTLGILLMGVRKGIGDIRDDRGLKAAMLRYLVAVNDAIEVRGA